MIAKFIERFEENKDKIEAKFSKEHPGYGDIVKAVIEVLGNADTYRSPDPERITCIDHGDYQGTLLYIIAAQGYQPNDYWFVKVGYGSCSGCDTLQAIRDSSGYNETTPTPEQVKDYMGLALNVVQGLKAMQEEY